MLRLVRFGTSGRFTARLARLTGRRGVASVRKLHLFALACLRRIGQVIEADNAEGETILLLDPVLVAWRCRRVATESTQRSMTGC